MARVHTQRAVSARPAAARHKASLGTRKPSYRVILEQVTQEKKKLITVVSFEAAAPPGYTFIPAGDPQLTTRCKQLSREDGVRVLIVSTTPHKHKKDLSQQVHRIGYHFPSYIVDRACMSLGVQLSQSGQVIRRQQVMLAEPRKRSTLKKKRKIRGDRTDSPKSDLAQATLDTQAREAIRDLFPKIPERDLHAIVARAFQKGKDRVGTAVELSLPRRVQLAVVAHIRHVYTDYDKLLKSGTWLEARARIERACLDQLAQWRGDDDDDDPNAMEDILREVIVIPDDDEDDNDRPIEFNTDRLTDRQQSVEIVSSHALAHEVQTRPVEYSNNARGDIPDRLVSPESEQETGIQYLGSVRYGLDNREPRGEDRRGYHRHRAWEEALDRRRRNPNVSHNMDHHMPLQAPTANVRTPQSAYFNVESFWRPGAFVQQTLSPHRPPQAKADDPIYLCESPPPSGSLLPFDPSNSDRRTQAEKAITMKQIPVSQQMRSSIHQEPRSARTDRYEQAIKVRPPEHQASSSERPRYVLVNSEQSDFAAQRNQRAVHKGIGYRNISIPEPAELRVERVLPSIEGSPRTYLAVQPTEQRERIHPASNARALERPSDRPFRVLHSDQGRDIQQMKRRRVDDQGGNSPRDPGRSPYNTSNDRILIPIGQTQAPRYEETLAGLAPGNRRPVPYTQQSGFVQPLGAAKGSGQRPYSQAYKQAVYEPVAEDRFDHPSALQYLPSPVRPCRSLHEAEGPLGPPLSHTFSDHTAAHRFHESSQFAVSNTRKLDPSRYGAPTPYVSSLRYATAPDSPNREMREEAARYEQMVVERDYHRRVHEGPIEGAGVHRQRSLHDKPQLEERGQIVYIPVQQDPSTARVQHRPRTQLPLEMAYQGLQSMTELSQPRYQDRIHPAEEQYGRVTHPTQPVQLENRPYPMYEDGHVEEIHSAAPRAEEKRVRVQGAPVGGQRMRTPPPRQHWDGRYSSAVPIQMLERPRPRGKMGAAQYESEVREQFVRRAPREIIVLE